MHRAPVTAPISRLSHRLPSMIIYFLISALSHFINNYSSFYCWPKFPLLFPLIDSVYLPLSIWSHPLGPIHLPLSIFLQSICLWSACDLPAICHDLSRSISIYLPDLSRSITPNEWLSMASIQAQRRCVFNDFNELNEFSMIKFKEQEKFAAVWPIGAAVNCS